MKNTDVISNLFLQSGTYFWDINLNTLMLYQSEELCQLLGIGTEPMHITEIVKCVPEQYRSLYTFEYMHNHKHWQMPMTTSNGVEWYSFIIMQYYVDKSDQRHSLGTVQLLDKRTELESGIDTQAVLSLIDLLPQLNDTDTFYEGMHKTLLRIQALVPHSTLALLRYDVDDFFVCCDIVGHTLLDRQANNIVNGSRLEIPLFRLLCEQREAMAFNDVYCDLKDATPTEMAFVDRNGVGAVMTMPVWLDNGQMWGMLSIMRATPTAWTRSDLDWITTTAKLLACCIVQSEKNHLLQEQLEINRIACDIANLETWKWHDYGNGQRIMHVNSRNGLLTWADNLSERLHPADRKKFNENRIDIREGRTNVMESVFRAHPTKKDPYTWVGIRGEVTERDASGRPITVMGVAHDIDERMKAQLIRKQQRQLQESIYEKMPVGIEVFDNKGLLIYANEKILELYGVKDNRKKLYGKLRLADCPLLTPEQIEEIRNLDTNELFVTHDLQTLRKGKLNPTKGEVLMRVVKLYEGKTCKGYLSMLVDNSIVAEQRIRLNIFNKYWDSIGKFSRLGIFWRNDSGFNYASSQWIENFNLYNCNDIFKHVNYHNVVEEDLDAFDVLYYRLINKEIDAIQQNMRVNNVDGTVHWISLYMSRNEAIDGIVALSADITTIKSNEEQLMKARERAEKADLLKSQFLANVSHEIRTPLNAIVGFSSLLSELEDVDERKHCADVVQKNTDLLLALINDILDLSRIESGTLEFSYSMCKVSDICRDVYTSLKPRCPDGVRFVYEPSFLYSDLTLYCDVLRIKQVIINLLTNAFKFTHSGEIRLWFSVENNRLRIHVSDTGIGIESDKIESIFNSFVKLDHFSVGTGIGLAISRSIARQMGGELSVESKHGRGSHFWLELPNINDDSLYWRDAIQWQRSVMLLSENSDLLNLMSTCLCDYSVMRAEAVGFGQFWLVKRPPLTVIDTRVFGDKTFEHVRTIKANGEKHNVILIGPDADKVPEADSVLHLPLTAKEFMHEVKKYLL